MSSLPLYSIIADLDSEVVNFPDIVRLKAISKDGRKGGLKILESLIQLDIVNECEKELASSEKCSSDHVLDLIIHNTALVQVLSASMNNDFTSSSVGEISDVASIILDIYAQALTACTPMKAMSNLSLQSVTVSTKLLNCLAFTSRSLTSNLWMLLKSFDILKDPSTIFNQSSRMFFCFCSIFHHQLQGIDDDELFGRDGLKGFEIVKDNVDDVVAAHRLFSLEDLRDIVRLLKQYLYHKFWVESAAQTPKQGSLFELQSMLAATKLFNHLCMRNERRNFMSESDLLWSSLSPLEFTIVNSSTAAGATDVEEPDDEGSALEGFNFRNQKKAKLILTTIPQVVSFRKRVEIFQSLIESDREIMHGIRAQAHFFDQHASHVEIQRRFILEDAAEKLGGFGPNKLKDRIQVTFISDQGTAEAGIDGGGLFKEFLDELCRVGFDPSSDGIGLFASTSEHLLIPSSSAELAIGRDIALRYFNFLGKILGKAVYERILVTPEFSPIFLNAILGRLNHTDDLIHMDAQVYQSFMRMKRLVQSGGDVTDFELDFQVAKIDHRTGEVVSMDELIPSGKSISVTNENVISYIHRFAHYRLNDEIAAQSKAFLTGFRELIPINWIRMFNPHELQLLIAGDRNSINIRNLRENVNYAGGYHDSHWCIQALWNIVEAMSVEDQGLFLKFITSCPRQPLLGFEQLNPKMGIQRVPAYDFGADPRTAAPKLPSAATCFNLLKLPEYSSAEELRERLLYAIHSNSGFELS
jgi:ubiquitin-protein ligase E3 C